MFCKKCNTLIKDEYKFCPICGKETHPESKQKSRRPNGTGYIRKRGKTYQIEITTGKKINIQGVLKAEIITKGGFLTKQEASNYANTIKAASGKNLKRKMSTLKSLWIGYSTGEMLKLSKSKQTQYKIAFGRLSKIENALINQLTIDDLQNAVDENTETYYPARDMRNLLSHLYKRAAAQQDVTSNLAEYICLPELEEKTPFPFSENDIKILWKDYGNGNKLTGYILLMLYSGMMPGELFQCKKDMIYWEENKIVGCGLKTKKRKETPLLIADFMIPVLKDLCEYSKSKKLLCMNRDTFYDEFHKTLARCNIKDRTPYACRHTTGTALALGNIAPLVIQEIMRHSKFSTTERYIHMETSSEPMICALNSLKETNKSNE